MTASAQLKKSNSLLYPEPSLGFEEKEDIASEHKFAVLNPSFISDLACSVTAMVGIISGVLMPWHLLQEILGKRAAV